MQVEKYCIFMTPKEFRSWLKDYKLTRSITKVQVHHTYIPNLETRKDDTHLETFLAVRKYHMQTLKWKAPGMNIMIYEDGIVCISLERNINDTPAGIAYANTGALCIENIGNYDQDTWDNGKLVKLDKMPAAQRESILDVYASLADKLKLPVDDKHFVYHCWYKADGTWLGDFVPGKSSKPCPGRNWWDGDGNTKAAANKGFLPDVRQRLAEIRGIAPPNKVIDVTPVVPIKEEELPMTKDEAEKMQALEKSVRELTEKNQGLEKTVDQLKKRVNLEGDVEVPKAYHDAVAAAKNVGVITSSSDKSKMELNVIQMFYNAGLLDVGVLDKLKKL